jgi:DNA-binding NtrC family response regulator
MVKDGRFREDLYFRLSMFHILIPPLRERKEDIGRLIQFVLHNMSVGQGKKALELDPIAEEILIEFAWPGNVRELENVINRAYILADGERITLADLPPDIARSVQSMESSGIEFALIPACASNCGILKQRLFPGLCARRMATVEWRRRSWISGSPASTGSWRRWRRMARGRNDVRKLV